MKGLGLGFEVCLLFELANDAVRAARIDPIVLPNPLDYAERAIVADRRLMPPAS